MIDLRHPVAPRRFAVALTCVSVAGALWRLVYLFAAKIHDPLLFNDSIYYSLQAGRNSEGDWFLEGLSAHPGAEHGPLTTLYLTPWSLGHGANLSWQRFAMTLVGIATVPVIGLAGRRLAGARVGLVAAAIAAVYPNLWLNDSLIMSESLAGLFVGVALLLALQLDERPTVGGAILLGVVVGVAASARSEVVLFALGFAVVLAWRRRGAERRWLLPALVLAGTVVTLAPWAIYNTARFEHPVLLTTNDGTTLLGANCPSTYYDDVGGWDLHCIDALPVPEGADASARTRTQRSAAVAYVREHLGRVPVVVLARVGRLFDVYGVTSQVQFDAREEKAAWAAWLGVVMWWVLGVLAVVGWRSLGREDATRGRRWWMAAPLAATLTTAIVFYAAHRLRAPAEPVVVLLAAAGLVHLAGRFPLLRGADRGDVVSVEA